MDSKNILKEYKNKSDLNYNLDGYLTNIKIIKNRIMKLLDKEEKDMFLSFINLCKKYNYEYSLDLIEFIIELINGNNE